MGLRTGMDNVVNILPLTRTRNRALARPARSQASYRLSYRGFLNMLRSIKNTPWPQSASKLYRQSDRRLSAKLVPTFLRI
jgi:hypothetical protein